MVSQHDVAVKLHSFLGLNQTGAGPVPPEELSAGCSDGAVCQIHVFSVAEDLTAAKTYTHTHTHTFNPVFTTSYRIQIRW